MTAYQGGDLAAFDALYAALAPLVRGALRRQGASSAELDDLIQETFLQVHRARHTYDPAYPPTPWVVAIARHVALMRLRASRRRPQLTEDVESLPLGVAAEAESYAVRADVHAALARLAPSRRRPVIWHHVLGLSFREIARRLGIGEDAAKLRSSRGVTELRRHLRGDLGSKPANE